MIHTVKGFGIVCETEVDVSLEFPTFLYDLANVGNLISVSFSFDFPGGSDSKASVYNVGDLSPIPGSGSFLEKEMTPTPVLLPRKSHGRRSLVSMGSQRVGHD